MRCYQYKQRQMSGKDDELIILYEGNFTDGQQQTSRIFIAQGRPNLAYPAIAHPASYFSPAVYHRSGFGDMQIIVRSISAYVLARIPIDLDLGVGPLYAWLEKLCTPFRILNLSPELRVNIYEQVIACDQIRNIGYPSHLRNEVLPVYSSNSTFKLRTYIGRSEYTLQRLNDWESATLASAAKFLRRPDVTVRASCRTNSYVGQTYVTLIVRYHECDDSLDLRTRFNMEQNSLDTLRALLADIPKTQALKGESVLVLAKQLFPEGHDPPHSHTYKWLDLRLKDGAMTEGGGDREDDSKIVQLCVALSDQGSVSDSKAGAFEQ